MLKKIGETRVEGDDDFYIQLKREILEYKDRRIHIEFNLA